ncbi:major facilitator superfamily domain-containing protein [Coniochaeta sp. 2T2.1]|nr:major facilitator superfamily domain-containing protein [Coniochaeta sp. 2T2.1]
MTRGKSEEILKEKDISPPPPSEPSPPPLKKPLDASSDIRHVSLTFNRDVPNANLEQTSQTEPPPPSPNIAAYIHPTLYPRYRKNVMLVLCCIATFLTAYSAGCYSPAINLLAVDLKAQSTIAVSGGISTFCLGFALAPMVLAPFSEINGRYPVFAVSGVLFVICQALCGVATNVAGMLTVRFFVGVGGSVFSTMVGGVIADLYDQSERNTPMALYSGFVLAGTGAGPLVGAAISNRLGGKGHGPGAAFKWVFWHQAIAAAVLMIALVTLFKETRASVLLSRKAKVLNTWYEQLEAAGYYGVWIEDEQPSSPPPGSSEQTLADDTTQVGDEEKGPSRRASTTTPLKLQRIRWLVKEDEERSSLTVMISTSLYRPFHLLFTEPVVFFFSLWVAFAWGVLYLTFSSIPIVYSRIYHWNIEEAGRIFCSLVIGGILGTAVGIWQEHVLHHPRWQADAVDDSRFWSLMRRKFPVAAPEARLYCTCVSAILLPAGLFIFGFTSKPSIHWVVPAIGIALATMGIYSVYLATFNYLADTYHKYASSALAAQSFCRNVLGGVFPLVTGFLFTNLGQARAGALLGSIAIGLTAVPWVLVFFGERIRARSPFASELMKG